jgi:hypothetical protein
MHRHQRHSTILRSSLSLSLAHHLAGISFTKFYACLVCQNRNIYHILKEAQKNRKTNTGC